jgi:hypothetical protein
LIRRVVIRIPPGLEVLGEAIEVIFLNSREVQDRHEAVLVHRILRLGIKADPAESGTESVSSSSHGWEG